MNKTEAPVAYRYRYQKKTPLDLKTFHSHSIPITEPMDSLQISLENLHKMADQIGK